MLTSFFRSVFCRWAHFFFAATLVTLPSVTYAAEPDCSIPLRVLVQSHNFPLAYYCAEQKWLLDPENLDALLVMARAAQELGQMELADKLAKEACTHELSTAQRFAAYLISGIAQANQGNLISAKILLYRASDFARADAELRVIRGARSRINRRSPWKFSAGLNVIPSTNINSGSLHNTIQFGGLEFVLDEDAKAQSGVAYTASAGVTHRTRLNPRTIWENQASISGTAYDGRGRNEGQYTLKSGLHYTPLSAASSLVYGFVAYDKRYTAQTIDGPAFGESLPHYSQLTYGLEYHRQPQSTSAWKVFATYTDRTSDISPLQDALIATTGGSYTFALNDNVVLTVSGYVKDTQADSADIDAGAGNLSVAMTWSPNAFPITLSGDLGVTHTEFRRLIGGYSDLRVDDAVTLELSLTNENIQFYGFNPVFGVALTRNYSNLNRYDTQTVQVFTRLSTSF